MTCAICGRDVGAGAYRDARGDPVHHYCRLLQSFTQATADTLKAACTPPRVRRQYPHRMRR